MNQEVEKILEDGLLEAYVAGVLDDEDKKSLELAIQTYPELKQEYIQIQQSLEAFAKGLAVKPPSGMKRRFFLALSQENQSKIVRLSRNSLSMAASVLFIIFLGTTLLLWSQNRQLSTSSELLVMSLDNLEETLAQKARQVDALAGSLGFLKDPETGKFVLRGNDLAPQLQTVAYWNPSQQESFIDILNMPELPENKCFQLWADVDGEMISLGVLPPNQQDLVQLPFKLGAASLNITIEPEGGSEHPHVDQLVASLTI